MVNVIPLSVVFALMGLLGIPLDMMSITIAAIAIGIGVDDAIHYIYRFREEIKNKSLEEAIMISHLSIGSALYYTTISIVLGFSVMMSSNFIPTIYFNFNRFCNDFAFKWKFVLITKLFNHYLF